MTAKIEKLAEIVRQATRSYDAGNRQIALKLLGTVAQQLKQSQERQQLFQLVNRDISTSGIQPYFHSILFGKGGTSIQVGRDRW